MSSHKTTRTAPHLVEKCQIAGPVLFYYRYLTVDLGHLGSIQEIEEEIFFKESTVFSLNAQKFLPYAYPQAGAKQLAVKDKAIQQCAEEIFKNNLSILPSVPQNVGPSYEKPQMDPRHPPESAPRHSQAPITSKQLFTEEKPQEESSKFESSPQSEGSSDRHRTRTDVVTKNIIRAMKNYYLQAMGLSFIHHCKFVDEERSAFMKKVDQYLEQEFSDAFPGLDFSGLIAVEDLLSYK